MSKKKADDKDKRSVSNMMGILLLSASVAFFIIGVHQIITVGFMNAYWIIMLSVVLLFVYQLRKRKN